jgi:hypothetical protein
MSVKPVVVRNYIDMVVLRPVNIEIQAPIWMMGMVHVDSHPFASNSGDHCSCFTEIPLLKNMVRANPGVDVDSEPPGIVLREFDKL